MAINSDPDFQDTIVTILKYFNNASLKKQQFPQAISLIW